MAEGSAGRIAVVTGGATGIGRVTALTFARAGATVNHPNQTARRKCAAIPRVGFRHRGKQKGPGGNPLMARVPLAWRIDLVPSAWPRIGAGCTSVVASYVSAVFAVIPIHMHGLGHTVLVKLPIIRSVFSNAGHGA